MSKINMGRVILGGLVAGLLINVVEYVMNMYVLTDLWQHVAQRLGLPQQPSGAAIAGYLVLGFALGLLVAWTYAAIRPRFGAGARTAVCAGIAVWVGAVAIPGLSYHLMGMYGLHLMAIGWLYGLIELVLAAMIAGAMYKEGGETLVA